MTRSEKLEMFQSAARVNVWLAILHTATVLIGVFGLPWAQWSYDRISLQEWRMVSQLDLILASVSFLFLVRYRNSREKEVVAAMFLTSSGIIATVARVAVVNCEFVAGTDPFVFLADQSILLLLSVAIFAMGIMAWRPWEGWRRHSVVSAGSLT